MGTKDSLFYKMDHKDRGRAIIFNNEHFDIPTLIQRAGTNVDAEKLKNTFLKLGFKVNVYDDKTRSEMDTIITGVSKEDHSHYDCFVLAVLSHGDQGYIFAKDGAYLADSLWTKFSADKCKTLAGKPKLFFIQACQGHKTDQGYNVRTETDSSSSYKIPIHADFLIAYSTIPGFYLWRNPTRGSWFIQALCDVLDDRGTDDDILTILTLVNQRVAIDFESQVPGDIELHAKKQIPFIIFMLTRLLKFNKG